MMHRRELLTTGGAAVLLGAGGLGSMIAATNAPRALQSDREQEKQTLSIASRMLTPQKGQTNAHSG